LPMPPLVHNPFGCYLSFCPMPKSPSKPWGNWVSERCPIIDGDQWQYSLLFWGGVDSFKPMFPGRVLHHVHCLSLFSDTIIIIILVLLSPFISLHPISFFCLVDVVIFFALLHFFIVTTSIIQPDSTAPLLEFNNVFDPSQDTQAAFMNMVTNYPNFVAEEWPHVLTWDLFVGRWIWLDGLKRGAWGGCMYVCGTGKGKAQTLKERSLL
jgi:hypothetical protein